MASTAADLVEHVLPPAAPLRQWVLTLPFELRARLAYDGELSGAVCRAFVDAVLGFYQRRLGARGVVRGRSGAVTAVQRVSSDPRLNPHFHTLALDGTPRERKRSAATSSAHRAAAAGTAGQRRRCVPDVHRQEGQAAHPPLGLSPVV